MKKMLSLMTLTIAFTGTSQIIYHDVNPDVEILMTQPNSASNLCPIDFGNDGTSEYNFRYDDWGTDWFMHMTYNINTSSVMALDGLTTNDYGGRFIKALNLNDVIDASLTWGTSGPEPFIGESTVSDNFLDLGDRYVGVQFQLGGSMHYGWVLVNFASVNSSRKLTVKSYAYETAANQSISAGDQGASNAVQELSMQQDEFLAINPVNEKLKLQASLTAENAVDYMIYDQSGRLMDEGIVSFGESEIDVSELKKGSYFIQVTSENRKSVQQFVKI